MTTDSKNYYQLLGVAADASSAEIEQAFEALRAEHERRVQLSDTDTDFSFVEHAYQVLSAPPRRAFYDSLLRETAPFPFTLKLQLSAEQLPILSTEQVVYLLAEVRATAQNSAPPLPLNLCLVLDRSTSMRGRRLQRVIEGVELMLKKLAPVDVFSVVSFSDRARVELPALPVREQQEPAARIRKLEASGGTEIFQGLRTGAQQIAQVDLGGYANHLVLLTDGQTYGDEAQCLQLAEQLAAKGISVSAFGIGSEWNDEFLDELVARGRGRSGYMAEAAEIITGLEEHVKGLGAVYARNLVLKASWPSAVQIRDGFKLSPFAQPLNMDNEGVLPLGDLEGRAPLVFLLELTLDSQPIPRRLKLPLNLEAEMPGGEKQSAQEELQLKILENPPASPPSQALLHAVRMLNLYRLNEKAWREAESGQLERAAVRMRHLTTRFLEAGEQELARQAHAEAERLERMQALSPAGRKQLKYGTRSLMGRTAPLEWDDSL